MKLRLRAFTGVALAAAATLVTLTTTPAANAAASVPSQGSPTQLDVGNWNVEWFGAPDFGPTNEALQQQNVRDVMAGADMDVWGLSEVVSTAAFDTLVAGMPGYTGVVANDPIVTNGAQYYSDFSNTEQKVALVWRSSMATLVSAKVILTNQNSNFAGRPPVEFTLRGTFDGITRDLVFIVLHAKSGSTQDAWNLRNPASQALKSYLDTTYPTQNVFVIGDWNDDVDTSITPGKASPYANFVNDAARYTFPTRALSLAGVSSTAGYPDFIDHQLTTNEVQAKYVAGSATAFQPQAYVPNYTTTTSDHYPVLARYDFVIGGGGGANQQPTASYTHSCTALNCTFTDGSTDSDGIIVSRSWDFGNGQTSTAMNPTVTYASAGTYAVSLTVTDNGGATHTTTQNVTVTAGGGGGPANVIINEVLANEPGSSTAGEAIEIVNTGGTAISIAGWTVRDGSAVRHTFAAGTTLQPGKAITVFGAGSAIPGGIVAVAASTGGLNLSNSGDQVILRDSAGATVQSMGYSSSQADSDGVSINRSPDGSATGGWVKHNTISSLSRSPGQRANGTVY
ncbi:MULTISPECIES: lamin tail domain-containing protein [unclassified Micromonospora]|uniref:lamin tail domain-containing protein n=1 Tax=unclassified Micromonospora TaxID=2617518 RepID=UPI0011D885DD|nr:MULTISPECIES: lamin tail domain-containing protein [unclassified Micromonospora]TYC19203.1 PKD domain-containing protein [Micromonospora sp. MP36]